MNGNDLDCLTSTFFSRLWLFEFTLLWAVLCSMIDSLNGFLMTDEEKNMGFF